MEDDVLKYSGLKINLFGFVLQPTVWISYKLASKDQWILSAMQRRSSIDKLLSEIFLYKWTWFYRYTLITITNKGTTIHRLTIFGSNTASLKQSQEKLSIFSYNIKLLKVFQISSLTDIEMVLFSGQKMCSILVVIRNSFTFVCLKCDGQTRKTSMNM